MKTKVFGEAIILILALFLPASVKAQDAPHHSLGDDLPADHHIEKPSSEERVAGAVFTVNDNGDATDANPGDGVCEAAAGQGDCTLRAAVAEANALAEVNTIIFDESITLVEVNGQIEISSPMLIVGSGADVLTIKNIAPAGTTSRVFNVGNFTVNMSRMTITGGDLSAGNGAGILNSGVLMISECVITQNTTTAVGGGIRSSNMLTLLNSVVSLNSSSNSTSGGLSFAGSQLTIINSTIDSNSAVGNGGGANISASSSVLIERSTFSNNTTQASSGGLFLNRGSIINSTISGNQSLGSLAGDGGGGVRIQSGTNQVHFVSCTITNNTATNSAGGTRNGIWHETGSVVLRNTIVAENGTQDMVSSGGTLASNGFNFIGVNTGVETQFPAGFPNGTDYVGTEKSPISPMLAPLADNGGPTSTQMPIAESPVIDKGHASGSSFDQRGFLRTFDQPTIPNTPDGDGTDIGAVETLSTPNTNGFTVSGTVTDSTGRAVNNATIVLDGVVQRSVRSGSFGRFRFENVPANEVYIISVRNKTLSFEPMVVVVNDDVQGIEISAVP